MSSRACSPSATTGSSLILDHAQRSRMVHRETCGTPARCRWCRSSCVAGRPARRWQRHAREGGFAGLDRRLRPRRTSLGRGGVAVTFRGVQVGTVTSVAVVLDVSHLTVRIPVELKLDADRVRFADKTPGSGTHSVLPRLIDAGLHAKLDVQSFVTGQMQVDLEL